MRVTNAFDYKKNIYLTTGDNLYCDRHKFKNEEILQDEAIVVIRKGLVNHSMCADAEINLSATIVELSQIGK